MPISGPHDTNQALAHSAMVSKALGLWAATHCRFGLPRNGARCMFTSSLIAGLLLEVAAHHVHPVPPPNYLKPCSMRHTAQDVAPAATAVAGHSSSQVPRAPAAGHAVPTPRPHPQLPYSQSRLRRLLLPVALAQFCSWPAGLATLGMEQHTGVRPAIALHVVQRLPGVGMDIQPMWCNFTLHTHACTG